MEQYKLYRNIYDDIASELELHRPYAPDSILTATQSKKYVMKQALIESVASGSHYFCTKGVLSRQRIEHPQGVVQHGIHDQVTFNGWEYDKSV